ncbi:MAG: hypothetical protein Kow0047_32460 [Anaerolineae bacterium]
MRERKGSEGLAFLGIVIFGASIAGTVYTIYLVGAETMRTVLLVMAGAISTAIILAALSLPIRAWRKNDAAPVEKHYIKETVLDGRVPQSPDVKLLQLPAPPSAGFPELLRAAYQAGRSNGYGTDMRGVYMEPGGTWQQDDHSETGSTGSSSWGGWDGQIYS